MKVISLFAGSGGLDLGFTMAGHTVVWANDNFADCVSTYKKNIGDHIHLGDICSVDINEIPDADMVIGGFPCQGFSIANMNRYAKDPRNKLYLEFLRVLKGKNPKLFLAENVRGILSLEKGRVFERIVSDFEDCGYRIQHALVNAADYGVPQTRYRVLILGIREDVRCDIQFPPEPTHSKSPSSKLNPWETVGKALKGLPEPEDEHKLSNHVYSKYKLKNNGYINHRKVDPNKPAPTVTARGDMKGGAMINHHPNNHRRMSVRETALVQSFPLDFEFVGSMTSCYTQIGNAVPPLLAFKVARELPVKLKKGAKVERRVRTPRQLSLPLAQLSEISQAA